MDETNQNLKKFYYFHRLESIQNSLQNYIQYVKLIFRPTGPNLRLLTIFASNIFGNCIFVPLAFWPGLTGKFMSFLPIGIIVTLLSSLFVALVINPVMISYLMKIEGNGKKNAKKYIQNSSILFVIGIFFIIMKTYWLGNLLIFISLFIISNYFIITLLFLLLKNWNNGF